MTSRQRIAGFTAIQLLLASFALGGGRDGAFYGTTEDGGRYGGGVVFRISLPSTPHHDSRDN